MAKLIFCLALFFCYLSLVLSQTTVTFQTDYTATLTDPAPLNNYGIYIACVNDPLCELIMTQSSIMVGETYNSQDYSHGQRRRGLIYFDLSSIPPNSVIQSATLTLTDTYSAADYITNEINFHRVTSDWSFRDPTKISAGDPLEYDIADYGFSDDSTDGDVSWNFTFFDSGIRWQNPGGDFDPQPFTSDNFYYTGPYDEHTFDLDVNTISDWVNNPSTNFGMLLRNVEDGYNSAMRHFVGPLSYYDEYYGYDVYDNRHIASPELQITYTAAPQLGRIVSRNSVILKDCQSLLKKGLPFANC